VSSSYSAFFDPSLSPQTKELLLFSCGLRQALPSLGNLLKLGKRAFFPTSESAELRKPIAGLLSHITLFNSILVMLWTTGGAVSGMTRWKTKFYGKDLIRHPNPSMHRGRVELLDIAYWTL